MSTSANGGPASVRRVVMTAAAVAAVLTLGLILSILVVPTRSAFVLRWYLLFVGAIGPGRGADFSKAVPVEVRAGGISIHGPFVVHGSSPNRSPRPRRLVLYGYQSTDQWKLFDGMTDKDLPAEFERRQKNLVRGELTTTIQCDTRMLRMPYPKEQGNLFVIQRSQKERYFK